MGKSKICLLSHVVKPTEPTDVALKIEEKVTMDITWKEPKCAGRHGIFGYIIYYRTTGKTFKSSNKVDCCRHKLKDLQEGTSYEVYIVAVDGQGKEGMKSGIKTTKTGGKLRNLEFFSCSRKGYHSGLRIEEPTFQEATTLKFLSRYSKHLLM